MLLPILRSISHRQRGQNRQFFATYMPLTLDWQEHKQRTQLRCAHTGALHPNDVAALSLNVTMIVSI
jgi:hypothetical protein